MIKGGFLSVLIKSALTLLALIAANSIFPAPGPVLTLKKDFSSGKKSLCLADIVAAENLAPRDAEKLSRYCQVALQGERIVLTAKDIELHSWAAGVIPEKISGTRIIITHKAGIDTEIKNAIPATQKIRRGSNIKLVLKSEHMLIARDAALLTDAFPGETVDIRPQGTRKTLRARLTSNDMAELVNP